MDDLFTKYKDLLLKNEELTIDLQKLKTQNLILQEELSLLKTTTKPDTTIQEQEDRFRKFFVKNKKYVLGLLGYEMEIMEDRIELLSLYSFHNNDKFVFTIENNTLNLLSNELTETYKSQVQEYLAEGKSIPAFLAYVTLDLRNKKTFQ